MTPAALLLALVTAERLAELVLARRNTAALLAKGAVEVAARHYPLIVALHATWLGALWVWGAGAPVQTGWLALFLLLQVARVWVLATLGPRWTTRIIVLPDAPLIRTGPYRWLSHPNYAIVVAEIAVLPLCLGLPTIALLFSVANAAVLTLRITAENRALRPVLFAG